ncbi:IS3 family transposase [Streptococcus thermophilus]
MVLRLLKIPKSTYFDWVHYTESQRQREDTILKALLREIWQNNYKAYGAPRLRLALADLNLHHGTNQVRRLMREAGIYSVMTRRFNKPTTTVDYLSSTSQLNQAFTRSQCLEHGHHLFKVE